MEMSKMILMIGNLLFFYSSKIQDLKKMYDLSLGKYFLKS